MAAFVWPRDGGVWSQFQRVMPGVVPDRGALLPGILHGVTWITGAERKGDLVGERNFNRGSEMQTIERLLVQNDNIRITLRSSNVTDLFWVIYDLMDNSTYAQGSFQPPEEEEAFALTLESGVYQLVCSCHCDGQTSWIEIEVLNEQTGETSNSSASNDGLLVYTAKCPFIVSGDAQ